MNKFSGRGFIAKMIIGTIVCTLGMSAGIMLLWNWLIPDIFHGTEITYLQALGLLILSKFFFGFRHGWGGGCGCKGGPGGHYRGYWRQRWEQKMAHMSPEEREKAKEKYKKCFGPWDACDDKKED